MNFAKDFKTFLLELQKYVKAEHTTGKLRRPPERVLCDSWN